MLIIKTDNIIYISLEPIRREKKNPASDKNKSKYAVTSMRGVVTGEMHKYQ